MLADVSDLSEYGLAPSEAAMAEATSQTVCALCHAPPLERGSSHATTLAWLDAHAPEEAAQMRVSTLAENERADAALGWKSLRTRAAIDSELWPGYAIPSELLGSVVARLDPTLADFVPDNFLAMICGRCAAEPVVTERLAPRLVRLYVEIHADGNEAVARAQPAWILVQRFRAVIEEAARGVAYDLA